MMAISWKCPECGLDYDEITDRDAVLQVRTFPYRYKKLLTAIEPGEDMEVILRERPAPDVWSAIEYAAHVAQTLDLMAPTIRQIVNEDKPHLYEFDPDKQAEEQSYNDWAFTDVLGELESACADLSSAIEYVDPVDWSRTGTFSYGEREAIDVARNAVHEGNHPLLDVARRLAALRNR
jgi:hypothetical protein